MQKIRGRKANLAFHLVPALAASNRETCAGAQRSRPAGVRTPRASSSWAMAAGVECPARWISAITARVVALALVACSDLAARARAAVSALPAVPSFLPFRIASTAGKKLIRPAAWKRLGLARG